jgi:hypothetical protein
MSTFTPRKRVRESGGGAVAAKKAGRKQALQKFLKSPRETNPRCETCKCDEDLVAAAKMFADARSTGKTAQTLAAFHRFLVEEFAYEYKATALFTHIKVCIPRDG